ncbi:MAG: permease-like cell division protein FtsX [Desulfobulbaceae bacterium]|nr:permease-like cell division protein FtsX [Desulfobulbaceae bacterium]
MRYLAYILAQTGRNLKQTWSTQCMTLLTVSLSVLIFAFFFLIYTNMLAAGEKLGDELRLIVYLEDEIVPQMQDQLERKIRGFSDVEKVVYVSRKKAFDRLSKQLDKDKDVLDDLGSDFLPPSIEVYPAKNLHTLTQIKHFADFLATLPQATKVQYGHSWVERFAYFTKLLQIIMFLSGGLLILTTTFMVSYTIRLTIFARREELQILRMLGATDAYIKVPLLLEGVMQGFLGTGFGLLSLYFLFTWIRERFTGPGFLNLFEFSFFPLQILVLITGVSIIFCAGGSLTSMRKLLRL